LIWVSSAREISWVPNDQSAIALTFDDGPAEWTEPILDTLRLTGVRATFFVIGDAIPGREATLRRTAREGHEIGSHALLHRRLDVGLRLAEIQDELIATSEAIKSVLGKPPVVFRPPGFGCNELVQEAAGACGFGWVVQASVWCEDWNEGSSETIAAKILDHAELRSGAIIDLHDGRPPHESASREDRVPTVAAVAKIVPALVERGFSLLSVSELLALE